MGLALLWIERWRWWQKGKRGKNGLINGSGAAVEAGGGGREEGVHTFVHFLTVKHLKIGWGPWNAWTLFRCRVIDVEKLCL